MRIIWNIWKQQQQQQQQQKATTDLLRKPRAGLSPCYGDVSHTQGDEWTKDCNSELTSTYKGIKHDRERTVK